MKNFVRVGLFMVFYLFVSVNTFAQTSGRANFGNYPADYPLAYVAATGAFSKSPTVRTLFGPNAYFAASFQDIPAIVTLESSGGSQGKFTAQLLLTVKAPEKGEIKIIRMQVIFESDNMSEMSYVRYIKMVNMIDGKVTEQSSYNARQRLYDASDDVTIMGFFVGIMEFFWDVSKYQ
jgi:ATP-dependent Clp protease adapter protein ClpS